MLAASLSGLASAAQPVVPLWPQDFLGNSTKPDEFVEKNNNISYNSVTVPSMEVFLPSPEKNTGAAVLVCPGGAYSHLAYTHEGTEIAQWLNKQGIAGIVLRYRIPTPKGEVRGRLPLQDAQRALSLIRSHAAEWKIDPERVGILGFSAGGHLSATTSTASQRTYPEQDTADKLSCRPNFTVLVYPAYLLNKESTKLVPEITISSDTPPAIMIHAANDPYTYKSSLLYFEALEKNKIRAELHVYAQGGHGYGMRGGLPSKSWPAAVSAWLNYEGWLKPRKK